MLGSVAAQFLCLQPSLLVFGHPGAWNKLREVCDCTPVVEDDVGVLHQVHGLHGKQQRVARPCAHQVHAARATGTCSHGAGTFKDTTRCVGRIQYRCIPAAGLQAGQEAAEKGLCPTRLL